MLDGKLLPLRMQSYNLEPYKYCLKMLRNQKGKFSFSWLMCIGVFCMILKISVYLQSASVQAALLAGILLNSLRKRVHVKFTQGNDSKCCLLFVQDTKVKFINTQRLCEVNNEARKSMFFSLVKGCGFLMIWRFSMLANFLIVSYHGYKNGWLHTSVDHVKY